MNENKIKQLEFIQGIISRMSSNSFALKGWSVTLVSGIFALSSKDADKMYFLIAYVPILLFWGLDSYYLQLERKYVSLYDYVRNSPDDKIDYDMDISKDYLQGDKTKYCNCIMSITEFWFYLPLALLSAVIIIITHI